MNVRLLRRRFFFRFVGPDGKVHELRTPEGSATARQLLKLNAIGALAVVEPGQVDPIRKGEAAAALDLLVREDAA